MTAPIRYLSVCSGIEAWSVACEGLGYQAAAFSEIDPFASAVLAHRFGSNLPGEPASQGAPPNLGDFTRLIEDEALRGSLGHIDLLVGGTPCQAFSFAGKRLSLADARGNLTLAFAVLAHELVRHGLRNAVWENVPGVLSAPDNAFGCFLGALVGADAPLDLPHGIGRWPDAGMVAGPRARAAWRVLDAQYFGLAQRRERVLLVVDLGGGADPAAVLFEPKGLQGNPPPRREKGQGVAGATARSADGGGDAGRAGRAAGGATASGSRAADRQAEAAGSLAYGGGNRSGAIDVAATLTARGHKCDFEVETFVAHTLRGHSDYGDGLPCLRASFGDVGGGSEALIAFDTTQITSATNRCNPKPGDPCHPLAASAHPLALAYRTSGNSGAWETGDKVDALTTGTDRTAHLIAYGISADAIDRSGEGVDASAGARSGLGISKELSPTLKAQRPNAVASGWAVRRLITDECARLQGFPDGWSRIPWRGKPAAQCPDGPQYKTYGNSMATKKMRWLARRLAEHMPEPMA